MSAAPVMIRHFTDPTCPFGFSAERQRLRLEWLYGDQLDWELHMIVLSEEPNPDFPPERIAEGRRKLHMQYGMPIDWRLVAPPASVDGCRSVVGARLHAPAREEALLRRLRVLTFAGEAIDDPAVLDRAATEAGLDAGEVAGWRGEDEVEAALREDMRDARAPSPASRAQDYKLGGPAEERRYTCPSYELIRAAEPPADWETASRVDLPGFRPVEAYETALANLAPELARRADPETVEEVVAWAGMPVATAEVAAVCDREIADVRTELSRSARFTPVGGDGYWTLSNG